MIISALNDNNDLGFRFSLDIFQPVGLFPFLPSSSNLMSLAAWMPSSFRFFSICLLRAREALSSALMAQPMMIACSGVRRASLLEPALPQAATAHHHFVTVPPMALPSGAAPGLHWTASSQDGAAGRGRPGAGGFSSSSSRSLLAAPPNTLRLSPPPPPAAAAAEAAESSRDRCEE